MLLGGGALEGVSLLKSETVRQMTRNQLPEGVRPHAAGMPPICNGFGYGFGVQTENVLFGSPGDYGWPGAYRTYFFIDPSHGGIGILLAQSTDFDNLPILGEFHQLASAVFVEGSRTGKAGGK
jgi:CubicO group peptidase (beta-lactamase class C family)